MATPHKDTALVLVLELDDDGAAIVPTIVAQYAPLAAYRVRDPEGIEDVLAITTGWTRNV
jgi:hypothetical protein